MSTTVEISGSHEKLAEFLLTSDQAVTLTLDGQPVGTFIPTQKKTREEAWESFKRATQAIHAEMAELGVTEDDIMNEYWRLHDERKTQGQAKP